MFADLSFSYHSEGFGALVAVFIVSLVVVAIICLLLLPALLIASFTRRKSYEFKRQREGSVIAQYDPPHNFTPAEIGYLYDLICGEKEFRATLFDLEQRKIIKVVNMKKITVLDQTAVAGLREHEKIAIDIFSTTPPLFEQVAIDNGTAMRINLPSKVSYYKFQNSVRLSLARKGFAIKSPGFETFKRTVLIAFLVSLWPLIGDLMTGTMYNNTDINAWSIGAVGTGLMASFIIGIFFWPAYLIGGYVLIKVWSKIAGQHWLGSKKVRQVWYEIDGYRLFIQQVDLDNIQFDATNDQDRLVNKTLPYAIALNLDTKWQQYFKPTSS